MTVANNWSHWCQIDEDKVYRPPATKHEKLIRQTGRKTPKPFQGLVSYRCNNKRHYDCIKKDCPCQCHKNGTDGSRYTEKKK